MTSFLGPSNNFINRDTAQSIFNEVVGFNYDFNTNYDGITSLDFRKTSNEQQVSVMFALNSAQSITSIEIWMKATANLTGTITATIFPEGAGVGIPATVGSLGASDAVNASIFDDTAYVRVKFIFPTPIALNAGQNYYAVLTSTVAINATAYIQIASDNTPVGYMRSAKYNGVSWSAQTYHSCHIVYYKATTKLAQSFRASGNQELDHVVVQLDKIGAPTGNLIIEIRDDLNGVPDNSGPANNLSDPVAISSFSGSLNLISFTFSTRPKLLDGNTYHFVLSTTIAQTESARINAGSESVTPSYLAGELSIDNLDGTWRIIEQDLVFEIYYFEQVVPGTLSDELALLGDPPLNCQAQQVWLKNLVTTLSNFYPSVLPPLYGGTGISEYSPGDLLYATDAHHLETLPIGIPGQALGISLGGLPVWGGAGQNLLTSLKNNSGGSLNLGDIVVYDLTAIDTVTTTTKIADRFFAGVVQDYIPAGEYGPVLIAGISQVRINGTVTAGDFLSTSAVARRAYTSQYGSMKALQSGSSGGLVYAHVVSTQILPPYAHFSDVQAFNVAGTSLTTTTWVAVGLNTKNEDSHSLFTLAANQLTLAAGGTGTYRVKAAIPVIGTNTVSTVVMRLRKVNGTPADLIIGRSAGAAPGNSTIHAELEGKATITAGDVMEFQVYCTAVASATGGRAHNISGFNNVYLTAEFEKVA